MESIDPWGSLTPFQGIQEVKTTFIIILTHDLPFLLCAFTYDVKAIVGKTAGALIEMKATAPNCSSSHCILHCNTQLNKNK